MSRERAACPPSAVLSTLRRTATEDGLRRTGCRFGWGRAFDSGSKLPQLHTLARNSSAPSAGDGAALANSLPAARKDGNLIYGLAPRSANLSKNTSNERLCLSNNDFVPNGLSGVIATWTFYERVVEELLFHQASQKG